MIFCKIKSLCFTAEDFHPSKIDQFLEQHAGLTKNMFSTRIIKTKVDLYLQLMPQKRKSVAKCKDAFKSVLSYLGATEKNVLQEYPKTTNMRSEVILQPK